MANNIDQTILTATNKNIGFKVGLESALNTIRSNKTATPGCFYLTGDTHRLYIGNDDQSISPVNPGVITVATINDLPLVSTNEQKAATAGNFYYVTGSNILCVYSGSANGDRGGWVQINPNTDSSVAGFTQSMATNTGVVTLTSTLTQGEGGVANNLLTKTDDIKITGAGGAKVESSLSGSDPLLTITGEQYSIGRTVSGSTATVALTPSTGFSDSSDIELKAGSNVSLTSDGTKGITIAAVDTINQVKTVSVANAANNGDGFRISVTTDNGVTGSTDVTRYDDFDPVLLVGDSTALSRDQVHFVNGEASIDVYTRAQMDAKLQVLDAMRYRGTMGNGGSILNASTITVSDTLLSGANALQVSVGDTYKLAGETNINGVKYPAGSIVIMRGTEDASTGLITSNLAFDIIAGSSEKDTTYQFSNVTETNSGIASEGIALAEQDNPTSITGTLKLTEGTAIDLSGSFSNNTKAITINHANVTCTPSTGTAISQTTGSTTTAFGVVTGVSVNSQGHVEGVTTTQITLEDSYTELSTAELNASVSNGVASISSTVTGVNSSNNVITTSASSASPVSISSDNLTISADGTNGIKINMSWGSF